MMSLLTMNISIIFHVDNINLEPRWDLCVLLDRMEVPTTTYS